MKGFANTKLPWVNSATVAVIKILSIQIEMSSDPTFSDIIQQFLSDITTLKSIVKPVKVMQCTIFGRWNLIKISI